MQLRMSPGGSMFSIFAQWRPLEPPSSLTGDRPPKGLGMTGLSPSMRREEISLGESDRIASVL